MKTFNEQSGEILQEFGRSVGDTPKTRLQQKICKWIAGIYESESGWKTLIAHSHQTDVSWLGFDLLPQSFLDDMGHSDYNGFLADLGWGASEAAAVTFSFYQENTVAEQFIPYIGLWDMIVAVCENWFKTAIEAGFDVSFYNKGILLYSFIQSDEFLQEMDKVFQDRLNQG